MGVSKPHNDMFVVEKACSNNSVVDELDENKSGGWMRERARVKVEQRHGLEWHRHTFCTSLGLLSPALQTSSMQSFPRNY